MSLNYLRKNSDSENGRTPSSKRAGQNTPNCWLSLKANRKDPVGFGLKRTTDHAARSTPSAGVQTEGRTQSKSEIG